jgi:hypothetical protein
LTLLAPSEWRLNRIIETNPEITFNKTREIH